MALMLACFVGAQLVLAATAGPPPTQTLNPAQGLSGVAFTSDVRFYANCNSVIAPPPVLTVDFWWDEKAGSPGTGTQLAQGVVMGCNTSGPAPFYELIQTLTPPNAGAGSYLVGADIYLERTGSTPISR